MQPPALVSLQPGWQLPEKQRGSSLAHTETLPPPVNAGTIVGTPVSHGVGPAMGTMAQ
jgi:hypothetical protein